MNQQSPAEFGLPSIEDLTLSVEQAALLHLFDRLRHLEGVLQSEILKRERFERCAKAQINRLKAEIAELKRGAI